MRIISDHRIIEIMDIDLLWRGYQPSKSKYPEKLYVVAHYFGYEDGKVEEIEIGYFDIDCLEERYKKCISTYVEKVENCLMREGYTYLEYLGKYWHRCIP